MTTTNTSMLPVTAHPTRDIPVREPPATCGILLHGWYSPSIATQFPRHSAARLVHVWFSRNVSGQGLPRQFNCRAFPPQNSRGILLHARFCLPLSRARERGLRGGVHKTAANCCTLGFANGGPPRLTPTLTCTILDLMSHRKRRATSRLPISDTSAGSPPSTTALRPAMPMRTRMRLRLPLIRAGEAIGERPSARFGFEMEPPGSVCDWRRMETAKARGDTTRGNALYGPQYRISVGLSGVYPRARVWRLLCGLRLDSPLAQQPRHQHRRI